MDAAHPPHPLDQELLERAPIALGVFDHDLRWARVNAALAAMNGLPVNEIVGKTLHEV